MRAKLLPVFFLLLGGGIGFAVVSSFMGDPGLARLAPADTVVWVEGQDLQGSLQAFRESEAWKDFEASESHEQFAKGWEQAVAMVEKGQVEALKQLGLNLDERTVMHLLGSDVALGAIAPADADPSLVLMTKLDVTGILQDVALKGDWTALWEKLQTALGGAKVQVESYKDYEVATRQLGKNAALYFTLVQDVLVFSHSKASLQAVIDTKLGERPSLADQAPYGHELAALPDNRLGLAYVDMAFLRDKERVKQTVHRLGTLAGAEKQVEPFSGEELQVLIDDLQDVEGLAVAAVMPEGSPYRLDLVCSRGGDELFRDNQRHDLRTLASDETMLYVEAHGVWDLLTGFTSSPALKALKETEAAQWLAAKIEHPEQLAEMVEAPAGQVKRNPTFELKTAWAVCQPVLREVLGNDLALVVETREAEETADAVRPLAFLRCRPLLRMLTDLASGAMAAHAEEIKPFSVEDYGQGHIYCMQEGPANVYWTRLSQDLVLSSHKDMVQRVIDRAAGQESGGEVQNPALAKTMTKLPDDYQAFVYMDQARYTALIGHAMPPGEAEQLDKLFAANKGLEKTAFAFYVDPDYTTWTSRVYQPFGEGIDPAIKGAYTNADPQPAAWSRLPGDTFASMTWEMNAESLFGYLQKLGESTLGKDKVAEMRGQLEKELLDGKDLEKDLIAHLGQSHGVGLVPQPKLPVEGAPAEAVEHMVAVPALVAALQVKDSADFAPVFKGLVLKGLEQLEAMQHRGQQSGVIGALYELSTAESLFREGDKENDQKFDYGSMQELVEAGLLNPAVGDGEEFGYHFEVYVSEETPEFCWMAMATPSDPQPDDVTYAINQNGQVMWTAQAVTPNPTCDLPEDAQPFDRSSPQPREAGGDAKSKAFQLEETQLAGTMAWTLVLPERESKQLSAMVGEGFQPCFAFLDEQLLLASSRPALTRMIQGESTLADSDAFQTVLGDAPRKVALSYHFGLPGVIEQVSANAEMIAMEAAPAPKDLPKPKYPEFPSGVEGDAFEKAYKAYEKETEGYYAKLEEWQGKVRTWRAEHAKENAEELSRVLKSLDVLGDFLGYSVVDDDQGGVESVMRYTMRVD